jgi:hypothetical protein
MNESLTQFQDAFVEALYGRTPTDTRVSALVEQPGFSVYRNTVFKGCIDALRANFPAVARLVGDEWFRAVAAEYVRISPPRDERLLHYGDGFSDFLASFGPARSLPYLAGVAQLDYFWLEAHFAADESYVTPSDFVAWQPELLEQATLRLHASTRWQWFADKPVYTIWRVNREQINVPDNLPWRGEGAMFVRPASEVRWLPLSEGGCGFLDACAMGQSLELAATQALSVQAEIDLGELVSLLLAAGVVAEIRVRGTI